MISLLHRAHVALLLTALSVATPAQQPDAPLEPAQPTPGASPQTAPVQPCTPIQQLHPTQIMQGMPTPPGGAMQGAGPDCAGQRLNVTQPQGPQPDAESPVVQAFAKANAQLMAGIRAPLSGNADRDFVVNMLVQHQAVIDMARIQLQYGADPEVRELANVLIAAQEKEIAWMKAWLLKHPQ